MNFDEKIKLDIHPVYILILYFTSVIPIFLPPKIYFNLIYCSIPILFFFYNGLRFKDFIKSSLFSIIPAFSYFIMFSFFSESDIKTGKLIEISFNIMNKGTSFNLFYNHLIYAVAASLRIFFLSILSFTSTFMIDIPVLFKYLMVKRILSFKYGYAFSIALNSISTISDEIKRINFLMKNREIRPFYKGFLPILVFGIRYSELVAISLLSKGFSEDRVVFHYKKLDINKLIAYSLIGLINFIMLLVRN